MTINPISQLAQMIAAFRKQIQKSRIQSNLSVQYSSKTSTGSEKIKKRDLKQVEKKLIERITKLDMTQDNNFELGVHIFVQEILLWEFGENLSKDPHFTQVLDEVMSAFVNDQQTKLQFTTLFSQMRMSTKNTDI